MTSDNALYSAESAVTDPAGLRSTGNPGNASGGDADQPQQPAQPVRTSPTRSPQPAITDDALHALRLAYERRRS